MSESCQSVALIVDDEPEVKRFVSTVLQQKGFLTLSAGSLNEAREVSRNCEERIDVLITDVELGDGDGISLAEQLHESRTDMAILVVSGRPQYGERAIAKRFAFLCKPFLPAQLLGAVRRVLAG